MLNPQHVPISNTRQQKSLRSSLSSINLCGSDNNNSAVSSSLSSNAQSCYITKDKIRAAIKKKCSLIDSFMCTNTTGNKLSRDRLLYCDNLLGAIIDTIQHSSKHSGGNSSNSANRTSTQLIPLSFAKYNRAKKALASNNNNNNVDNDPNYNDINTSSVFCGEDPMTVEYICKANDVTTTSVVTTPHVTQQKDAILGLDLDDLGDSEGGVLVLHEDDGSYRLLPNEEITGAAKSSNVLRLLPDSDVTNSKTGDVILVEQGDSEAHHYATATFTSDNSNHQRNTSDPLLVKGNGTNTISVLQPLASSPIAGKYCMENSRCTFSIYSSFYYDTDLFNAVAN